MKVTNINCLSWGISKYYLETLIIWTKKERTYLVIAQWFQIITGLCFFTWIDDDHDDEFLCGTVDYLNILYLISNWSHCERLSQRQTSNMSQEQLEESVWFCRIKLYSSIITTLKRHLFLGNICFSGRKLRYTNETVRFENVHFKCRFCQGLFCLYHLHQIPVDSIFHECNPELSYFHHPEPS